jgi:hypothetical protein
MIISTPHLHYKACCGNWPGLECGSFGLATFLNYLLFFFRSLGDNKHWMQCTLRFAKEAIQDERPIPYKYTVHSPKIKGVLGRSYPWEYIHNVPRTGPNIVNRCLQVPTDTKGTQLENYVR